MQQKVSPSLLYLIYRSHQLSELFGGTLGTAKATLPKPWKKPWDNQNTITVFRGLPISWVRTKSISTGIQMRS